MLIKLSKAIELSLALEFPVEITPGSDNYLAIKLGLAALRAIELARQGGSWHPKALLPGEQPEEIKE